MHMHPVHMHPVHMHPVHMHPVHMHPVVSSVSMHAPRSGRTTYKKLSVSHGVAEGIAYVPHGSTNSHTC